MPWGPIGHLDDEELAALYEYLTHLRGSSSTARNWQFPGAGTMGRTTEDNQSELWCCLPWLSWVAMGMRVLCMKTIFQAPACFWRKADSSQFWLTMPGSVSDAALIDVGNPCRVAADVDVGFRHVPFVTLAREVLGLDEGHDGVSVESGTSIEDIKVWRNDRVELRNIVCQGGSEYRAHCIYDLSLIGGHEFLLGSCGNGIFRKH
jgi:hypothetical protein